MFKYSVNPFNLEIEKKRHSLPSGRNPGLNEVISKNLIAVAAAQEAGSTTRYETYNFSGVSSCKLSAPIT